MLTVYYVRSFFATLFPVFFAVFRFFLNNICTSNVENTMFSKIMNISDAPPAQAMRKNEGIKENSA